MDLRQLRYFIAVAEELHFTRAAERLHIGQPPLSHAIQSLEADIGAQLFERTKRWVRLTDAGKLLLPDARRILAQVEQAADTARKAQRGEAGELRIGFTSATPLTPLFANVIQRYRRQFPAVTLTLLETSSLHQLDALARRTLDLGFIRPPEVALPPTVALTRLRDDALVAVLPTGLALAKKKTVSVRDLAELPFVMYPPGAGTAIHPQIFRLCRAAGFEPRVAQEAGEAATIIGLVAAGCGVSILPLALNAIRLAGVCYRPIAEPEAVTTLLLAHRRGEREPLVDAFRQLAQEVAGHPD